MEPATKLYLNLEENHELWRVDHIIQSLHKENHPICELLDGYQMPEFLPLFSEKIFRKENYRFVADFYESAKHLYLMYNWADRFTPIRNPVDKIDFIQNWTTSIGLQEENKIAFIHLNNDLLKETIIHELFHYWEFKADVPSCVNNRLGCHCLSEARAHYFEKLHKHSWLRSNTAGLLEALACDRNVVCRMTTDSIPLFETRNSMLNESVSATRSHGYQPRLEISARRR